MSTTNEGTSAGSGAAESDISVGALIDDLKSEDVELRLKSISKLSTISRALGAERTRNELVPFLTERDDEDDECLLAIAAELATLIDAVGERNTRT